VDDLTVRFTLFERNAIFPLLIAENIITRHKFEDVVKAGKFDEALGTNSSPEDMPVTGPFMFGSYDGSRVILKRNPNYYRRDAAGNGLPYLDEIVTMIVPDIDVQTLKFTSGETDIIESVSGKDYPNLVRPRELSDFTIYRLGPNFGESFLVLNQNTGTNPKTGKPFVDPDKVAWFRDVRFRRAMSHLMDRPFMADGIYNGLAYPQYGPMSAHPNLPLAKTDLPSYKYDLDQARALLAEMGLKDRDGDGTLEDANGRPVEFNLTTNVENEPRAKVAATMAQDMQKVGIRVNFRAMSFNTLITKLDFTYDWEACVMSLTGSPEPAWGADVWKSSGRLHMWFPRQKKPSTPWEAEIDECFAKGLAELDPVKRKAIYGRWQEIVVEQQPFIYTVTQENLVALRNRFGNIFPAPLGGVLHNIEEIYVRNDSSTRPAATAQGQR
jgi:peptide/nickel transport system substrate-binding protein